MRTITAETTRFPSLTNAVLAELDRDQLRDVANHGADAGFPGFTYYSETVAFFKANKRQIIALAEQMSEDFGQDMLEMISGFRCLKDHNLSPSEIGEAIWSGEGENADTIQNALAWFALEEVARELNPEL